MRRLQSVLTRKWWASLSRRELGVLLFLSAIGTLFIGMEWIPTLLSAGHPSVISFTAFGLVALWTFIAGLYGLVMMISGPGRPRTRDDTGEPT